jgi:hypothetical protein
MTAEALPQVERFFRSIFGEQRGYLCLACRPFTRESHRFYAYPADLDAAVRVVGLKSAQTDLYVCGSLLAARDAGRGKNNALSETLTVRADLDSTDAGKLLIPPTVLVETSPGRLQAWWRLESPIPTGDAEALSRRIATYHKGDGADPCWDATHLYRVPFTTNHKPQYANNGTRPTVKVIAWDGPQSYRPKDFDAYPSPVEGQPQGEEELPEFEPLPTDTYFRAFFELVKDEAPKDKKRSDRTHWFMQRCAELGLTPGQIRTAVHNFRPALDKAKESPGWLDNDVTRWARDEWPKFKDAKFNSDVKERAHSIRVHEAAKSLVTAEREATQYREPPESRTLAEEFAESPPEPRWAILDLAPDGGNVGIEAKKKSGKTTLMGNLARSLVDHVPFLGEEQWVPRKLSGNVGYANYELHRWQFDTWLSDMGIRNQHNVIPWHLRGLRMPMNVDLVIERYIRWLTDHDIEVWILDPRNRAWRGMVTEENSNSQVEEWAQQVDVIKREAGIRECYIPAHMGHNNEHGRGASSWGDWLDAIWQLTVKDGYRYISAPEGRDVDLDETQLIYDPTTRLLTLGQGSRFTNPSSRYVDKAVEVVTDEPGIVKWKLEEAIGNKAEAPTAIAEAVRLRLIHVRLGARRSQHHYLGSGPTIPGVTTP